MDNDKEFLLELVDRLYHQNLVGVDVANLLRGVVNQDEAPLLPGLRGLLFTNKDPGIRYGAAYVVLNYYLENKMFSIIRELLGNCADLRVNEGLTLLRNLPKIEEAALQDPNGARLLVTHSLIRKAYKRLAPLLTHDNADFRREAYAGLEEELLRDESCIQDVKGVVDKAIREGKLTKESLPASLRAILDRSQSDRSAQKPRSKWALADLFLSGSIPHTDPSGTTGGGKKKLLN